MEGRKNAAVFKTQNNKGDNMTEVKNSLIERAARMFLGSRDDWRMVDNSAVHDDADIRSGSRFDGPSIIRRGRFSGGHFLGGVFLGGEFYGGLFRGGRYYGGIFLNGNYNAGQFSGGEFHGGEYHGGRFYKGQFLAGTFRAGLFRGGRWDRSPVFVQGSRHSVCESNDSHIVIGSHRNPVAWWEKHIRSYTESQGYMPKEVDEYEEIFRFVITRMKSLRALH